MENVRCKICVEDIESHDIDGLFKCGTKALKEKKWDVAGSLFGEIINRDPQEPRAYFGKLLAECECTDDNDLVNNLTHISDKDSYKKAYQFGDDSFKRQLDGYNDQISYNVACQMLASKNISSVKNALDTFTAISGYQDSDDMAEKCKEKIYGFAAEHMAAAKKEKDFLLAKSEFEMIKGYADADAKAAECASKSDESTNLNALYQEALKLGRSDSPIDLKNAIKALEEIIDYRDSKDKIEIFKKRYQDIADESKANQRQAEIERQNTLRRMQEEDEKKEKRARITKIIVAAVVVVLVIIIAIVLNALTPDDKASGELTLVPAAAYMTDISDGIAVQYQI